jgi:hypothetical protein
MLNKNLFKLRIKFLWESLPIVVPYYLNKYKILGFILYFGIVICITINDCTNIIYSNMMPAENVPFSWLFANSPTNGFPQSNFVLEGHDCRFLHCKRLVVQISEPSNVVTADWNTPNLPPRDYSAQERNTLYQHYFHQDVKTISNKRILLELANTSAEKSNISKSILLDQINNRDITTYTQLQFKSHYQSYIDNIHKYTEASGAIDTFERRYDLSVYSIDPIHRNIQPFRRS